MKKIGIITFHNAINYGAVLQAFALQEKFKEYSELTQIVDYRSKYFKKLYGIQKDFSTKNIIKFLLLFLIKNLLFFIKKLKFNLFIKRHINLTRKYTKSNIKDINTKFDYIITGSDQVFNLKLTNKDYIYYLDFCNPKQRCSYAASFGNFDLESVDVTVTNLLKSYRYLSLREKDAVEFMKEKYSIIAEYSLDPTLLYSGREWEQKLKLKKNNKNQIFYYKVAEPNQLNNYVEEYAKQNNLNVIEITSDLKKQIKGSKVIRTCSPISFVNNIYNSKYIATTSFHATVFGILFHKKLIIELYDKTGKFNNRIFNLLTLLNIEIDKSKKVQIIENVDWDIIERKISNERKKSINFILKIGND